MFRSTKENDADNRTYFIDRGFHDFAEELSIQLNFVSVAHQQSNGQVDVINRTLKE